MVIKQVKHWMKLRASAAQWKPIADWVGKRGGRFAIEEGEAGESFSIEEAHALGSLLVEWGAPQRDYMPGAELRLRWDLGLKSDLQVMVLERALMDALEAQVFEAYTDTLQTRVDTDTPEEMRWLVMFPRQEAWSSRVLRSRFGACGATAEMSQQWTAGALAEALALASQDLVPAGHAFVMLTQRGRLYLRTLMPEPSLPLVQGVLQLAEVAAREAQSLSRRVEAKPTDWAGVTPSAFGSTQPPDAQTS